MEERKKQARMVNQSSTMENLPSHILIEIIFRLPIKSVMAIRCVCKSLLSLVSDSHFQILHSIRAPTELLFSYSRISSTTLCIAEYVFQDDSVTAVDTKKNRVVLELPRFSVGSENYCDFGAPKTILSFVNSCYGLVCFRGPSRNRFAVICNPFTREFITFPCPARIDKTLKRGSVNYGLGFSPKVNSFKLLRLIYRKNVDTCVGEVYTFGARGSSWKRVANCPNLLYLLQLERAIFHEGALHWYCTPRDGIVTFDFDTELFGKLVTPPRTCDMHSSEERLLAIGVFENCLYTTSCVGDFVDIWVLKEYGQGSWLKIFSIQSHGKSFGESYQPFTYLQNGQVLMFKNYVGGIVCFNPDTGRVKEVGGIYICNGAVFIRPSLVSLKVLLGYNLQVHSVKPWDRKKTATNPCALASSVTVKDVVKADRDSAPSSSEALASLSHPIEEKVEDVLPTILVSQQGSADVGSFGSQDPTLPKDRCVGQSETRRQTLEHRNSPTKLKL